MINLSNGLCPRTWGVLVAGILPLTVAGCPPFFTPDDPTVTEGAKLVAFNSPQELLKYFREQANDRSRSQRSSWPFLFGGMAAPLSMDDGATGAGSPEGGGSTTNTGAEPGSGPFSDTNIQEVGVDESDVIKSDGTYFYIARDDTLRIVKADPVAELAEVGRLDLEVHVSEMYLYGSKLLLLAQRYEEYDDEWGRPQMEMWPPYHIGSGLTVVEVDVSDPATPMLVKDAEYDGTLADSRLTNGRLILVLTVAPDLPPEPTTLAINVMPLDAFMPKMRDTDGERDMIEWQDCLHPESPDGYFMTAVLTLDAADIDSVVHSTAIVAGAGTIYASQEALYVTDAEYDAEDGYRESTAVHKFAFDENGAAQYTASGSIPGRLLNQFSLGEYNGYLHAATHVSNPAFFGMFDTPVGVGVAVANAPVDAGSAAQEITPPTDFSAVYVLGQTGGDLEVTGSVENIAPNETLHSARFMGDHGFVVTFRKIDPLFVLDLGDPTNPQVVGELKVPGFSDYLHPLDDTHLIGVGKATSPTDQGFDWFQGVQISLFDVSDWSNPTAVQQITLGGRGSESEVDYTHKGFTFLPESGLLAIPMRLYSVEEIPFQYGDLEFEGVIAFQVDAATGFTELGRLATVGVAEDDYYRYYGPDDWARAAFIGETLYAISPDGVAAAALADFETTTAFEFVE